MLDRPSPRRPSRPRRLRIRRPLGLAFALSLASAAAGQNPDSYYVNPAGDRPARQDPDLGEIGRDLGGFIPFGRYGHPAHSLGLPQLESLMRAHVLDLPSLQAALEDAGIDDPLPLDVQPVWSGERSVWWDPGISVQADCYRINGGPVLVVRVQQSTPQPMEVLVWNRGQHDSDWGSRAAGALNFNDFSAAESEFVYLHSAPLWPFDGDQPNLRPDEQALMRGDLVVHVLENLGSDVWTNLLRNQDAVRFVREVYAPSEISQRELGRTYLDGASWGALMAGISSLLQPALYAGTGDVFIHDLGFHLPGVGDYNRLWNHEHAGLGLFPPARTFSDRRQATLLLLVDVLGIRHDPGGSRRRWDLAAFSTNHRPPGHHRTPVLGAYLGAEDSYVNGHWQQDDARDRPTLDLQTFKNYSHGLSVGVHPDHNQVAPFAGDEWARLLSGTLGLENAENPPLVPRRALAEADHPYPDPYSHTLRPGADGVVGPALLSERRIAPEGPLAPLGQGSWIGHHDGLFVDTDDEHPPRLVFGNFEGFVHALELDDGGDSPLLRDVHRSPRLGWGLFAAARDGNRYYFGDQRGTIHVVDDVGSGYQSRPPLATADGSNDLLPGAICLMHVGEFAPTPGRELLVLGQQLDWALFDASGRQIARQRRSTRAVGPGRGSVADVDGDGIDELYLPCLDGQLWRMQLRIGGGIEGFVGRLEQSPVLPPRRRALYRAETFALNGRAGVVLFGRNDDFDPPDRVEVRFLDGSPVGVPGIGSNLRFGRENFPLAFSWLPDQGDCRCFVAGAGNLLEKYVLDPASGAPVRTAAQQCTPGSSDLRGAVVTAVEWMEPGKIAVALGSGRVFLFDEDLQPLRRWSELSGVPEEDGEWPSNLSLAHCFAADLVDEGEGPVHLYAADFPVPVTGGLRSRYRVAELELRVGEDPVEADLDPEHLRIPRRTLRHGGALVTRSFHALPTELGVEFHWQAESSTLLEEGGVLREFCNRRTFDGQYGGLASMNEFGGYVFEVLPGPTGPRYLPLSDFVIPHAPPFHHNGDDDDWFYPKVGEVRLRGQIASLSQSTQLLLNAGTSMDTALLPPLGGGAAVPHVVTGTNDGHVYAIRPGAQPTTDPLPASVPSILSYSSPDLGWKVVGMDTGRLHSQDPADSVVVGTWLDTGDYEDWLARDPSRNRGQLVILTAQPPLPQFRVQVLSGDDLLGEGEGLGSGVYGVRLDDLDGDGIQEIWCGDAGGHLYLFRCRAGTVLGEARWDCVYRSESLGAYAGACNQIFPIHREGRTVELVVLSSGYLHRFDVHPELLPPN